MAKKKKKTFPKHKILELFKHQNYMKVVSKIKQFRIDGMDDLEVETIHIDSLKLLSDERFKVGDIQRAIKDIESALNIKSNSELEYLKLKYLCYLDRFSDAKVYADALLQKYKSDKKIIFYSLLVELYLNNKIDILKLKKLAKAKQEYLFAVSALFDNDIPLALKHLNNSKPRAKAEKNNIEALKAIVLQKTDRQIEDIKPLYKFLLFGDDTNLQNSKNSREYKDNILKQFKLSDNNNNLKKLIMLDGYIDNHIVKKKNNPKLALNNITLMLEKSQEPDYISIYKIFISYEKEFIKLPESIYILIDMFERLDTIPLSIKIVSFLEKYLEINGRKLAPFALNYILYKVLFHNYINDKSVDIIESLFDKYGNKDIFYTTLTFAISYDASTLYKQYKINVDTIFKKYTQINTIMIRDIIKFVDTLEYAVTFLEKKELKSSGKKVESFLCVINELSDVDEKYKNIFLEMINSFAKAIYLFEEKDFESGYENMRIALKKYIKRFDYQESQLCDEADEFLDSDTAISTSYIPDIIKEKYIKFKMALKTGLDPFVALENYPDMYMYMLAYDEKTAIFDLIMEYNRFEDLSDEVIDKIFRLTNFNYRSEFLRTSIQTLITRYANEHLKVSQKIFQYILKNTNAQSVWYLNWLYSYIVMVDNYNLDKDKFFIKCIDIFFKIQNRKKFKSTQKKYDLIVKRFDIEKVKNEQQTFEF